MRKKRYYPFVTAVVATACAATLRCSLALPLALRKAAGEPAELAGVVHAERGLDRPEHRNT
eukprot:4639753-Alexandrium_andersonii.AAC.1